MDQRARPYRSALYIPASKERALDKARGLPADAILFDLEDAVAPDAKPDARALLGQVLTQADYGPRARIVRINGLETPWGRGDAAALTGCAPDGVLLPKVDGPEQITALAELLPDVPIWAMMETPRGILNAARIAAHPRMAGMVMGTNDLAKELGCQPGADRAPLQTSLQHCLLAARAHGLVAVDGVFNAFKDTDGLQAECVQGRDMGFDGKTLIHPAQLETANAAFAPDADAVTLAQRQIAAFEAAQAAGEGVAVLDGQIVENLHVETARRTLARVDAIAQMEAAS